MMASDFIIDVNETDFEFEVLAYSQNIPVVVDFWAPWCQPCKTLTPLLEGLAREAQGAFRLARVNVDDNTNLAVRYGVRSIPTVKAFSQHQVVAEFVGLQPEERIREFLTRLLPPSKTALAVEKAASLLADKQWASAERLFRELDQEESVKPAVQLGLIKAVLAQGKGSEAAALLYNFPPSREFASADKLRPLAENLVQFDQNKLPDENELDATFRNSLRLAKRGNLEAAMDGLIEVLRQDRRYRSGRARVVLVSLLELYSPEDPTARQYRNEMASVLF
jgi:putative thioredoxin